MRSLRVTVTYTVDVVDEAALVRAGADAWAEAADGWTVVVGDDGADDDAADAEAAVAPTPEASLSWVLGRLRYPAVPGVRFTGMGVDVQPDPGEPPAEGVR